MVGSHKEVRYGLNKLSIKTGRISKLYGKNEKKIKRMDRKEVSLT